MSWVAMTRAMAHVRAGRRMELRLRLVGSSEPRASGISFRAKIALERRKPW